MSEFESGKQAGNAWATETGTTSDDLRMVPVVKGSRDYKRGHRIGVAEVRRARYLAENNITPE